MSDQSGRPTTSPNNKPGDTPTKRRPNHLKNLRDKAYKLDILDFFQLIAALLEEMKEHTKEALAHAPREDLRDKELNLVNRKLTDMQSLLAGVRSKQHG